jgi:peptidoglycan biosynthesis protein MviN/MurJ (putative lipid II flippase)
MLRLPRLRLFPSALVGFVRTIQATAACGAGAAPDAFRAAMSMTVAAMRAVEAAAPVC